MVWLLVLVVVGGVAIYLAIRPKNAESHSPVPAPPDRLVEMPQLRLTSDERRRLKDEVDAQFARVEAQVEVEAAKIEAAAMREAEAAFEEIQAEEEEEDLLPTLRRSDFVAKEDERHYLTRDQAGLPTLRLVDAGDRLAIWSPLDGGALINPKGPGLRSLGLYSSYGRGAKFHASAYRTADLRKGRWVELKREPDNPHDGNAVAIYAPRARAPFAYVQKGRAPAIARRMAAGEDMAGVTLWGPGRGSDDNSTLLIIGSRTDLTAMLDA